MSAAEIIEEIKKLPLDQFRVVQAYVQNGGKENEARSPEYISSHEVDESADEIFEKYSWLFQKLAQ